MNRLLSALMILILAAPASAGSLASLWSYGFGGASTDFVAGVDVDTDGNVVMTGYFVDPFDFGGGLLTPNSWDALVAKYDASGNHVWSANFGGPSTDRGRDVKFDSQGNIVIAGAYENNIDFGGGSRLGLSGRDIYVAKFDPNGNYLWDRTFFSNGLNSHDDVNDVVIDSNDNILVTGYYNNNITFGGSTHFAAGDQDSYLLKLDSDGNFVWSVAGGGPDYDESFAVAVDSNDHVLITGAFYVSADFGGVNLVSAGAADIFMVKFDDAGTEVFSVRMGSTNEDWAYGIRTDSGDNILLIGEFYEAGNLGAGNIVGQGSWDIFIAKYDLIGSHLWSHTYGDVGSDTGFDVEVDADDNVLAVASIREGTIDFGGGPFTVVNVNDGVFWKLDSAGNHLFSQHFSGTSGETSRELALGPAGELAIGFTFSGTLDVGGGPHTGNGNILLAYYGGEAEPAIASITDIGNDQGGLVHLQIERSGFDTAPSPRPILSYGIYRRDDPPPAGKASANDATDPEAGLLVEGWTFVGQIPAHGETGYGATAPTIGDSTVAHGLYESTFFVRAATATPAVFYDSEPVAGYSLDNLSPQAPMNFAYVGGVLSWDESAAADFDYFTVYGSDVADFGTATLVNYTTGTSLNVGPSPYDYYFVTATDFSGNEGPEASLFSATAVEGMPRAYVLGVGNYPNPLNPSTTVKYTVPVDGRVRVGIYDSRGRGVRMLVDEQKPVGAYQVEWNGRSDSGASLPSGVYFARVEQGGVSRSKKMTLLK